jgi:channel protein (hemolysin III family)
MSGVYHLLEKGTTANHVLRILDYSGIYFLIAGTFTPLHIILMRKAKRWLTITIVWIMAATGITLTAIFFRDISEGLVLTFFLAMGHMALFTMYSLYKINKRTALLVSLGGLAYTTGALMDFLRWPVVIDGVVGPHEMLHLFVMIGAGLHWYAIYRIADIPISQKLTMIVNNFFKTDIRVRCKNERLILKAESEEEMRNKVDQWMNEKFPEPLLPKSIKYQYIQENIETIQ